jgi:hypothetical protein
MQERRSHLRHGTRPLQVDLVVMLGGLLRICQGLCASGRHARLSATRGTECTLGFYCVAGPAGSV